MTEGSDLFPNLTARENVTLLQLSLGRDVTRRLQPASGARVKELAEINEPSLAPWGQTSGELSGDQRQRGSLGCCPGRSC